MIPIGTLMKKIHRHEKYVTMNPPSGGPTIGPIVAEIISQAIAVTSSLFEQARSITSRPTGDISAPPIPCSMRDATRKNRFCDTPHRIDPSVNKPMAARNTVDEPHRSASLPLAGMNIASVGKLDVSAMFMRSGSVWKLAAMVGSAVASTVPSSCSMNIALATISATVRALTWLTVTHSLSSLSLARLWKR